MFMKGPGSIRYLLCQCMDMALGMVDIMAVIMAVIMVCTGMEVILYKRRVNSILKRTEKVLLSNGGHEVMPVYQIMRDLALKNDNLLLFSLSRILLYISIDAS